MGHHFSFGDRLGDRIARITVVDLLEKFFDKVNHDRLMAKLARVVGDKTLLKLIRRYLGRVEIIGGSGKGVLTLNGVYSDSGKVDLASLGGRGQMKIFNVSIKNYAVLNKLYNFLGARGKDSLKLSNASFTFDVTDGRVYFNRLIAFGRPFDFKLDGWHGFDGTLDYKLAIKFYPPISSQITRYLKSSYPDLSPSSDGTLALGLVAGGTTNDARFTIVSFKGKIADKAIHNPNNFLSLR